MFTLALRVLAFAAFVVFGILWSSDQKETFAALWAVSFALVAVLAIWADLRQRPTLAGLWAAVPSPSKDPADYR